MEEIHPLMVRLVNMLCVLVNTFFHPYNNCEQNICTILLLLLNKVGKVRLGESDFLRRPQLHNTNPTNHIYKIYIKLIYVSHISMESGISISVPYHIDVVKLYGFSYRYFHLFDNDFLFTNES